MAETGPPLPRWGTQARDLKAQQILATVAAHWRGAPLATTRWCDIGCGNGVIAASLAPHVAHITGLDPEPWPDWPRLVDEHPGRLQLRQGGVAGAPLPDAAFDVVVCNQVYEHVDDPVALIALIRRVLRPGGLCYFAGPNLLYPVEPHVYWPFVHWLPRGFAQGLLRAAGVKEILDANSTHYWKLRHWLRDFEIENALPFVLRNPRSVGRSSALARAAARLPEGLIRLATPFTPGFVFILRKPA